jgi:hypothetical protein
MGRGVTGSVQASEKGCLASDDTPISHRGFCTVMQRKRFSSCRLVGMLAFVLVLWTGCFLFPPPGHSVRLKYSADAADMMIT